MGQLDPELVADARRSRRLNAALLALAAVVGGSPVFAFAVTSAAGIVAGL